MIIGVRSERSGVETRVAVTPASVTSMVALGIEVAVEAGAGADAGFSDDAFREAGASVVEALEDRDAVDVLLCVAPPSISATAVVRNGGAVVGFLEPSSQQALLAALSDRDIGAVAMELIPRSSLAQSMDALSSQATAAGYAAVLLGAGTLPKFLPMLVTAAGTVPPAKVLILGVGVAGLQAIATARRLGAVVYAYDIRPETREQVESLGARFVEAPTQQMDEGGYARAVDEDTAARQREVLSSVVAASDIVITTAQVPGRAAPRLIDRAMVLGMQPGSVIIDMAASSGGNVEGSIPDRTVDIGGVSVLGPTDLAARVATDASRMYARNLLEVVTRMTVDAQLVIDAEDAVIGPALVGVETDDE
jgi:proton-translocating NAD(P)+ transhydrogenase subunit alpha